MCSSDPFDTTIVDVREHRPWPLPSSPWVMTQSWNNLLFAHWRIDGARIRPYVPAAFDIDRFDGSAWLAVVPFYMTNVGIRGMPSIPGASAFGELNVRTYVRRGDKPGVFFFSLDAASAGAVWSARAMLNLPYFRAAFDIEDGAQVIYSSRRRRDPTRAFSAEFSPAGSPFEPQPGSLEYFLTERYCLYATSHRGRPYRLDIHHRPWTLQVAAARLTDVSIAAEFGVDPRAPDLLHFARRQDVLVWLPQHR